MDRKKLEKFLICGVDKRWFPGSFRGMPQRDDMETKLAGAGMATGEDWKDAEFTGDPAMGDDFRNDEHPAESDEDWEMSDEEIDDAVSTFAGLADELDGDPDDEDLDVFGGDDELLGGIDDEDFDLLGGDELVVDDEDELDGDDDWEDSFEDDPVLEDFGELDEF